MLFYKSIFVIPFFRKVANGALVIIGAWTTTFTLTVLFQDNGVPQDCLKLDKIGDYPALLVARHTTNVALDIFILCLPLTVIRTLQVSRRKKWLLSGVFRIGG